jgi:hypothetical protein
MNILQTNEVLFGSRKMNYSFNDPVKTNFFAQILYHNKLVNEHFTEKNTAIISYQ